MGRQQLLSKIDGAKVARTDLTSSNPSSSRLPPWELGPALRAWRGSD